MLIAASKRIKQLPHWNWKSGLTISSLLSTSFCLNCSCNKGQLYGKRFNKILNGYVSTSHSLQNCRNYQRTVSFTHPFPPFSFALLFNRIILSMCLLLCVCIARVNWSRLGSLFFFFFCKQETVGNNEINDYYF